MNMEAYYEITGGVATSSGNDVEDYTNLAFVGRRAKWMRNCMNEPASIFILDDGTPVWAPRTSVRRLNA